MKRDAIATTRGMSSALAGRISMFDLLEELALDLEELGLFRVDGERFVVRWTPGLDPRVVSESPLASATPALLAFRLRHQCRRADVYSASSSSASRPSAL
jgi:hypothetical protein